MPRQELPKVKVGDTLLRLSRGGRTPVEVVRVGRKYLTIKIYGREFPYDKVSGYATGIAGQNGDRLATAEMLDLEERAERALTRISAAGWTAGARGRRVSLETLEQIADLLDP